MIEIYGTRSGHIAISRFNRAQLGGQEFLAADEIQLCERNTTLIKYDLAAPQGIAVWAEVTITGGQPA